MSSPIKLFLYANKEAYWSKEHHKMLEIPDQDLFEAISRYDPAMLYLGNRRYEVYDLNLLVDDVVESRVAIALIQAQEEDRHSHRSSSSGSSRQPPPPASASASSSSRRSAEGRVDTLVARPAPRLNEVPLTHYGKAATKHAEKRLSSKVNPNMPEPELGDHLVFALTDVKAGKSALTFRLPRRGATTFFEVLEAPENQDTFSKNAKALYGFIPQLRAVLCTLDEPHSKNRRPHSFLLSSPIEDVFNQFIAAAAHAADQEKNKKRKVQPTFFLFVQEHAASDGVGECTAAVDEFFALSERLVQASKSVSAALTKSTEYHHLHNYIHRAVETSIAMVSCDDCSELLAYPLFAHGHCRINLCTSCLTSSAKVYATSCHPKCTAKYAPLISRSSWTESYVSLHLRPYLAYLDSLGADAAQHLWSRLLPAVGDDGYTEHNMYMHVDVTCELSEFLNLCMKNDARVARWKTQVVEAHDKRQGPAAGTVHDEGQGPAAGGESYSLVSDDDDDDDAPKESGSGRKDAQGAGHVDSGCTS